ncbi:Chromatin assembly factor 1 subunit, partial [Teratosphaeriaceae sp. CCFEE 6253]
ANSVASTPQPTPTAPSAPISAPLPPALPRQPTPQYATPAPSIPNPPPSPFTAAPRPASPARSMSTSSIATEASSSFARVPDQNAPPVMNNPTPSMTSLPSVAAAGSSSTNTNLPLFTPPQTPGHYANGSMGSVSGASVLGAKRMSDASEAAVEEGRERKRRVQPTLVEKGHGQGGQGGG